MQGSKYIIRKYISGILALSVFFIPNKAFANSNFQQDSILINKQYSKEAIKQYNNFCSDKSILVKEKSTAYTLQLESNILDYTIVDEIIIIKTLELQKKRQQVVIVLLSFGALISLLFLVYFNYRRIDLSNYRENYLIALKSHGILPEDYIANLKILIERWQKESLSDEQLKFKIFICTLNLIVISLNCKIQNLLLDRNRID